MMNLQARDIKPRDCQTDLINKVGESIRKKNTRIIACASTGFGKSITLAAIVKRALDKRKLDAPRTYSCLILLPRRDLVLQLSASFNEYGIKHGVIMSGIPQHKNYLVQIMSVDTYQARLDSGKMKFMEADFIILDECHLLFTTKKLEIFEKYPLVIGFTATPVAPMKRSLGDFYHEIVEAIPMKALVELGFLVPMEYFAPTEFHPENVALNANGDYRESALIEWVDNRLKDNDGKKCLVGDIYDNWAKIARDRKTVIFCGSQDHAKYVRDEFISHGVVAEYMDCNTETDERKRIFDGVRNGDIQVICNVAIVGVGVDLPIVSCVVVAKNTNLLQNWHQWAGRGSRPYEGKKDCYIIDHCGITAKLGMVDDETQWSLDGKVTAEQRKKEAKESKKEPKEMVCKQCHNVFAGSRKCPKCGFEMVSAGSPVPVHQAEMVKIDKKTINKIDGSQFYAELKGYAAKKGYKDGWAWLAYHKKMGCYPKNDVSAMPPSRETVGWVISRAIAKAKAKSKKT